VKRQQRLLQADGGRARRPARSRNSSPWCSHVHCARARGPSSDPVDREQHDVNVEIAAMKIAQALKKRRGQVIDVHSLTWPARRVARQSGFDLLSIAGQ